MMSFDYTLENAGWATFQIQIDGEIYKYSVSYLHDSLLELSESAISLIETKNNFEVIFMDEPGELILQLSKDSKTGYVKLNGKWDKDTYAHRNKKIDEYYDVFTTKLKLYTYVKNIFIILDNIYNLYGEEGYLEKWGAHEFPVSNYHKLKKWCQENTY